MPQIHNQLTRGPWTVAIKAALGDTRAEGGVERYGETMQPILDLWRRPEHAFLRRERLMASTINVVSAAGTIPEGILFNPPGSNILGVVKLIKWAWVTSIGSFFTYRMFRGAALPGGFVAVNSGPVDTRDPQLIAAPASGLITAQAANAVRSGGLEFDAISVLANVRQEDYEPIVLAPGSGVTFGSQVVGVQQILASLRWYERLAFKGELPS